MAITDKQIKSLKVEAHEAGDDMQELVCTIALEGAIESYEERFGGGGWRLSAAQIKRLEGMSEDQARAECERVIREAQAQA